LGEQEEGKVAPKRLDYLFINSAFKEVLLDADIIGADALEWPTDHGMVAVTIMSMPMVRMISRHIYIPKTNL